MQSNQSSVKERKKKALKLKVQYGLDLPWVLTFQFMELIKLYQNKSK